MPTLDGSWSPQIRKIGDLERQDHWHLTPDHDCYFFGEYTARAGYSHSSTNQIIANIKKKPNLRGTAQWQYKVRDMRRVAATIRGAINPQSYGIVTLVPIPPSKLLSDPAYDSRITDIARMLSPNADVRELIVAVTARQPFHESEQRLTPDQLIATLQIQEAHCNPAPQNIILINDVIATGAVLQPAARCCNGASRGCRSPESLPRDAQWIVPQSSRILQAWGIWTTYEHAPEARSNSGRIEIESAATYSPRRAREWNASPKPALRSTCPRAV